MDDLEDHWLCGGRSYLAFDQDGLAIYAGSFTFHFGDGYFLVSADGDGIHGDCVLSLNDLSRKRKDGYPAFLIVDSYPDARACLGRAAGDCVIKYDDDDQED